MNLYLLETEYFQDNYTFADLATVAGSSFNNLDYYTITLTPSTPTTTFTATATAKGDQTKDTDCLVFSITDTSQKTATSSHCWGD
ncbi:MAG: hypothetical protein H7832_08340 [Magnetococcus sp. DMHC-6]